MIGGSKRVADTHAHAHALSPSPSLVSSHPPASSLSTRTPSAGGLRRRDGRCQDAGAEQRLSRGRVRGGRRRQEFPRAALREGVLPRVLHTNHRGHLQTGKRVCETLFFSFSNGTARSWPWRPTARAFLSNSLQTRVIHDFVNWPND